MSRVKVQHFSQRPAHVTGRSVPDTGLILDLSNPQDNSYYEQLKALIDAGIIVTEELPDEVAVAPAPALAPAPAPEPEPEPEPEPAPEPVVEEAPPAPEAELPPEVPAVPEPVYDLSALDNSIPKAEQRIKDTLSMEADPVRRANYLAALKAAEQAGKTRTGMIFVLDELIGNQ